MSSFFKSVKEFRGMYKEVRQSVADGTFVRSPMKRPATVPTASDLRSRTPHPSPILDLVAPGHQRQRDEAPFDWDADPTVSTEPLPYTPLSAADAQIRILTVLPAERDDQSAPIRCTLETVSMVGAAPTQLYDALSYCWGRPDVTRTIAVDGHRFEVTVNLHAALREMRRRGFCRLWVDAVCISQRDREEHSQQLLRMRSIYASSARTLVWLGPESRTSNLAMHLLRVLSKPGTFGSDGDGDASYREAVKERSSEAQRGMFAEASDAIDAFFAREYWERVWIIQEITVSRKINIVCGTEMISWKELEVAFWGSASPSQSPLNPGPTAGIDITVPPRRTENMFDFCGWRKYIAAGEPKALLKAILDSRTSKATDPRDHIYGLLGITLDGPILVPVPNYKLSPAEVFTNLATAMIDTNKSIAIISLQPRSGAKEPGLPSWVPDWSNMAAVDRPYAHKYALRPGPKLHDPIIKMFNELSGGAYRTFIKNDILCTSGRLYDIVDGISGSVSVGCEPQNDLEQPGKPSTRYPTVLRSAEATQHSLCMLMDWSKEVEGRDCADLLTGVWLPGGGGLSLLRDKHPLLRRWLEANRDFVAAGAPLAQWLDMYHGGAHGLVNKMRDKAKSAAKQRVFLARLDEWMGEVEDALRGGMRLMTTARGGVGMAHPQVKRGDHIAFLEGMDNFVLLRPYTSSESETSAREVIVDELKTQRYMEGMTADTRFSEGYQVVGEAYIRTTGSGKQVEDMSACTFFTFFIH
ncbi:hypothetical protein RB595_001808 [Gaeumannomyces hyphopodioides]